MYFFRIGMQLVMNLDQEQYMRGALSQSAGARAVVFNPGVDLMPEEYGFDLQPDRKTG